MNIPRIRIDDYHYELLPERIASYPLPERDSSKLLIASGQSFKTAIYRNVADHLPREALMIFNNSKVIPARLLYVKETSGVIELFCLEPVTGTPHEALQDTGRSRWICMIGGLKKWKTDYPLHWNLNVETSDTLTANFVVPTDGGFEIEFVWNNTQYTFADILHLLGQMPIPPYLLRRAEKLDELRYQTMYASVEGSVAAPTAGLHFTDHVFERLDQQRIIRSQITLHVGAGTFKPVNTEWVQDHAMHAEWVEIEQSTVQQLITATDCVAVGTTSLRTLESLYWFALLCHQEGNIPPIEYTLPQFIAYDDPIVVDKKILFENLLEEMEKAGRSKLIFKTSLMILPGYKMRVANYLLTNFHQPKSTLLLLVDAFTNGVWKAIYDYALSNDYRFLSYGDGCLIRANVQ